MIKIDSLVDYIIEQLEKKKPIKEIKAELLEKETFDLILTDLKMPGMDGLEVLAKAKQQDEEALVMVITAYGSLESAEEAMAKGAFDYITKPFRKEQILLAIDKAMRWREMVRQNKALKQRLDGN